MRDSGNLGKELIGKRSQRGHFGQTVLAVDSFWITRHLRVCRANAANSYAVLVREVNPLDRHKAVDQRLISKYSVWRFFASRRPQQPSPSLSYNAITSKDEWPPNARLLLGNE